MVLSVHDAGLVAAYGIIPSFCMLMGSLVSSFWAIPPPKIVFALQHLAGGIILSAIAIEFVPILINGNNDLWEIPTILISFLGGAGMLILVGDFMDEAEEQEPTKKNNDVELEEKTERNESVYKKSDYLSLDEEAKQRSSNARKKTLRKSMVTKAYEHIVMTEDQKKALVPTSRGTITKQTEAMPVAAPKKGVYPLTLALAVALDAFLDGTFIGITFAASNQTGNVFGGFVLALSLSIEMTFLGLTFAVAIPQGTNFLVKMGSILMGPVILFAATFFGAGAGLALQAFPVPFQALTAFGASALLFTVGEELLTTAHEDSEEHEWWIDFTTIAGFLITIVVDKVIQLLGVPV